MRCGENVASRNASVAIDTNVFRGMPSGNDQHTIQAKFIVQQKKCFLHCSHN